MKKSTQDLVSVKKIKMKPYIMHNVYDYMNAIKTIEKQTLSLEHELSEEIYVCEGSEDNIKGERRKERRSHLKTTWWIPRSWQWQHQQSL